MAQEYARRFYEAKTWRRTQAAYMASQNYICERCGSPARIVHHRVHITPENIHDPAIAYGWDNLEAVCLECHNGEHFFINAGISGCVDGLAFDAAGNLTKTPHHQA